MRKWTLILLGTLIWSLTMVKSGLPSQYGIGFWGPNGHDAVWHLALIESMSQGSFSMPVFAGSQIKNYHIGFDAFVAGVHYLTKIPSSVIYFQIIPPILAFVIGLLSYNLIFRWSKSDISAWWSTFFVYFAGSLGWLFSGGESHFWAQQSISTLVNPPYAISLVILLLGLLSLSKKNIFLSVLCFSLLPHLKIYAGLLAFSGLFIGGIQEKFYWKVLFFSLLISMPIYYLINPNSTGLILFQPGWFLETLFAPDRLNFPRFFSALNTYRVGNIWLKAIPAFSVALLIFTLGNMGTRLLKIVFFIKWLKLGHKLSGIDLFIYSIIGLGVLVPMLFIQKGTAWNTIQFFYYSLFFSSLLAGIGMSTLLDRFKSRISIRVLICVITILITIPTTIITLGQYLPARPPAKLDTEELMGLKELSKLPKGTVLTVPYDPTLAALAVSDPPRPLRLYESTAYVSAFSGQPTYLADEVNLTITDYPWQARRDLSLAFFKSTDSDYQSNFLNSNSIKYIYLAESSIPNLPFSNLELVFKSSKVSIYRVLP